MTETELRSVAEFVRLSGIHARFGALSVETPMGTLMATYACWRPVVESDHLEEFS